MSEPIADIVVAAIHDGFGNQLFQYAMGRALALRLGVPLALDLGTLGPRADRAYALDALAIEAALATRAQVRALRPDTRPLTRALRRLGVPGAGPPATFFAETSFYHHDPRVLSLRAPIYVDGFWQSARYFEHIRDRLEVELRPRTPPSAELAASLAWAEAQPTVAVHVRRGDYLSSEIFWPLPLDYYARAADEVQRRVPSAVFVVFSDDPAWTHQHLKLPGEVRWSWELGATDTIGSYRLMSSCRHFVIANSSFSWWPAFLHAAPEALVVAPQRWFHNPEWEAQELLSSRWHLL